MLQYRPLHVLSSCSSTLNCHLTSCGQEVWSESYKPLAEFNQSCDIISMYLIGVLLKDLSVFQRTISLLASSDTINRKSGEPMVCHQNPEMESPCLSVLNVCFMGFKM